MNVIQNDERLNHEIIEMYKTGYHETLYKKVIAGYHRTFQEHINYMTQTQLICFFVWVDKNTTDFDLLLHYLEEEGFHLSVNPKEEETPCVSFSFDSLPPVFASICKSLVTTGER